MKKIAKILLLTLVLLFINTSNAQTQDSLIKDQDQISEMINHCLLIVLKIEQSYVQKSITKKEDWDNYFIWLDYYPAGFEPSKEIREIKCKFAYRYDFPDEQLKEGVYGLGFSGVRIDRNKILLNFTSISVNLRHDNKLLQGICSEGYSFVYEYSCEKKEWVLIKSPSQNGEQ